MNIAQIRYFVAVAQVQDLSLACRELKSFLIERMDLSMVGTERKLAALRRVRTTKDETQGGALC